MEGGGDGTRKRYSSTVGGTKTADDDGFGYAAPLEVSYKGCLTQFRRTYNLRLLRKLRLEGVRALGPGATEADVQRVFERLVTHFPVCTLKWLIVTLFYKCHSSGYVVFGRIDCFMVQIISNVWSTG